MPKPPASHGAPWTRQDFATIRKLVREGTPTRKIAQVLGRSLGSLYVVASKEGIALGGPKESEPNRGRPNHAAWRACSEFAHAVWANAATRCTENSPLRSATLTCAKQ